MRLNILPKAVDLLHTNPAVAAVDHKIKLIQTDYCYRAITYKVCY